MDEADSKEVDKALRRQCTCGGVARREACAVNCYIFIAGEPPSGKPPFYRTREALKVYDEGLEQRNLLWANADTNLQVHHASAMEQNAQDRVRDAFVLDTLEINTATRSRLIHPDDPWLRRIVELKE